MFKFVKKVLVIIAIMMLASVFVYADSEYSVSGAMITKYNGNADVVTVPAYIDGVAIAGIDSFAFENKDMHTVIIENGIEVIQIKAFLGCENLQYVKSPESMLLINENAFFECSENLQIEASDSTYIMDNESTSADLSSDTETEPEYENYNGFLYEGNTIMGYVGEEAEIVIPESINEVTITKIAANAFEGNTTITKVVIPDTVTTIGGYAFKGCTALEDLSLTKKLSSAGVEVFSGCTALKSVIIPGTLKRISKNMFYNCSSLTSVVIENGTTSLAPHSFYNCTNLKNVSVPNTVTSIETWSFGYCKNLESFDVPDKCTFLDSAVFYYCIVLNNIHIPDTVKTLGSQCFRECWNLSDITLSKSITSIQYRLFHNCPFSEIEIPESVTSIGKGAFYQCTNLINLEIPETVTSIGTGAFYGCSGLEKVIIYGTEAILTDIYTEDRTGVVNKGPKVVLYVVADSVSEKCAEESEYPYVSLSGTANVVESFVSVNDVAVSEGGSVLVEDDSVYVKYTVISTSGQSQNLKFLICLYDEDGRFVKTFCAESESIEAYSVKEIDVGVMIDFEPENNDNGDESYDTALFGDIGFDVDDLFNPDLEDSLVPVVRNYYAKVILIDALDTFKPLCEAIEI